MRSSPSSFVSPSEQISKRQAGARGDHHDIRARVVAEPERARDHVAVGVALGVLGREDAGVDQLLHHGMVGRDAHQLVALEPVDPAVADVEHREGRDALDRAPGPRRSPWCRRPTGMPSASVSMSSAAAARFASSVARSRKRTPLRGERCSTAAALARSPAAWPPIPSATANIGDATTTLSSLLCLRCPTSLRAAQLSTTLPPPGIAMRWPTRSLPMWLTRSPPSAAAARRSAVEALGRQQLEHVAVAEVDEGAGRDDGGFPAQQRARLRSGHDHGRSVRRAHVGRDDGVAGLAELEVGGRHLLVGGGDGDQPHPPVARDARHARPAARGTRSDRAPRRRRRSS